MGEALVIEANGSVCDTILPDGAAARGSAVRGLVGGYVDQGRYHRDVVLHVRGDGAAEPNLVAWALASVWRGVELDYFLYGTVVVTAHGAAEVLPAAVAGQVRAAGEAVAAIAAEWRSRRPASDRAALAELLAGVRHEVLSAT
ncbi:hypothetical protein [Streptomyces sp. NPDC046985]|uniref:hypothetical protein n=1 Tax=Streptomyces sp. NPDC046985 TaxID=3155377 RepID=UPI0033D232AD